MNDAAERAARKIAKSEDICHQEVESAVRVWSAIIREEFVKE